MYKIVLQVDNEVAKIRVNMLSCSTYAKNFILHVSNVVCKIKNDIIF